eukprot:CAMPEP_0113969594 /NCGR_PEP_ID=MMETSP0011_2-20120614/10449_1 /TAXON_ID=101924 /ORGANISM="Rhodosorus marinus" /LENGTH=249 /DNA_ID=CAMNT_0000983359 /DNA_START=119 /DNA_END=868 /DNA_ORIENTATION=+ /assembly_acc=CAM_ASM_000156
MMMVSSEGRALGGSYAPRQRRGPPTSLPEPDYSKYDENILNVFLMARFQRALERELDMPTEHVEFDQIVSLSHKIRSEYNHDPLVVRQRVQAVFEDVFGGVLPMLYKSIFAERVPRISEQLAAIATSIGSQWLMGPNELTTQMRTVEIERCRFLEASGCVNACVNGCKKPTEAFMSNSMGVDLYIEPNYEDFSCKFQFGQQPPPESDDPAFGEPCFLQCPTATRAMKSDGFLLGSKCENTPFSAPNTEL